MGKYDSFYEARDLIAEVLRRDLLGPVEKNEIIGESPLSYYLLGKLHPLESPDDSALEERDGGVDSEVDAYDSPISQSNSSKPSSMGMSFALAPGEQRVTVRIEYALYEGVEEEEAREAGRNFQFQPTESASRERRFFRRSEHSRSIDWEPSSGPSSVLLEGGISANLVQRVKFSDGSIMATVSLSNTNRSSDEKVEQAHMTAFQPAITVFPEGLTRFKETDFVRPTAGDAELRELEMLYSKTHRFAQGHGCSVEWDDSSNPSWIRTEFLPCHRVTQMRPKELAAPQRFSMKHLCQASKSTVMNDLKGLTAEYRAWISEIEEASKELPEEFKATAEENLSRCRECADRLDGSISRLEKDDQAFSAFQLANEAMLTQRKNVLSARGKDFNEDEISWYPFQLAFLLLEVDPLADPKSPERKVTDLLWFPTGGGKTEAYLGAAAFVIFLRWIKGDGGGVTVIMRYTLRLLTMQQFERAAALIIACEHVRVANDLPGPEISIGMYVGGSLSPNKLTGDHSAEVSLEKLQAGSSLGPDDPDPVQLKSCPWCGHELTAYDYRVDASTGRMLITCPAEGCEFHDRETGLPVHIVDESVYEHLPTFLVATVDKFAQVPLKEEASRLFGIETSYLPPDLVVQDELHLISGPLGSMVGIYEAAFERLCERDGVRPKVISSTATVRNAAAQLMALYGQTSFQFPPQGIEIDDSFFAVAASPDEKPDRLYIGLLAQGHTQTTAAIRVSAALLFATRLLEARGYDDEVIDAYWTIVEYFNSLRELGSSLTNILDDVQGRFSYLATTKLEPAFPGVDQSRRFDHILELTSRRTSSEITRAFKSMEHPYMRNNSADTFDFVLATNMLSVGVDVARLGAMIVYGQPKTNSEYIQATSRVGRSNPGLVISLLNPKRSRDRSHFEQFEDFHSAFYKHVESTSITPFSDRARDRALHTVFVTLCRYLIPGFSQNDSAGKFRADMDGVESIIDEIVSYVAAVDPHEAPSTREELEAVVREWDERAQDGLLYHAPSNPYCRRRKKKTLFKDDLSEDRFKVMNSMRSVEPSANLFLARW